MRPPFAALLSLLSIVLIGCNRQVVTEPIQMLDITGPVAVDIDTFAGDVTIQAGPQVHRAQLVVSRDASHGWYRADDAEASLESIGWAVDVVPGEMGQVLRITSRSLDDEAHFQRLNIRLALPAVDGLTVQTTRGTVEARGVQGPIDIRTTEGNVLVASELPLDQPITIVTSEGDIDLRMRGESRGELDFQTTGGRVYQRVTHGRATIRPGSDHDSLLASFNEGTNPILLRTSEGDIRFNVITDPLTYKHLSQ